MFTDQTTEAFEFGRFLWRDFQEWSNYDGNVGSAYQRAEAASGPAATQFMKML